MYTLFGFEKRVAERPATHISVASLRLSYIINKNRIVMTNKGSYIQRLSLQMICPGVKVLRVTSHGLKCYIYIYGEKKQFINISIGTHYQQ